MYYWDNSISHYRNQQGTIMDDYAMIAIGYKFPPMNNVPLWTSQGIQLQLTGNPLLTIGLLIAAIFILKG